jgi:methylated-DNA-[protein]-cysteine S-methyltransferase
MSRASEVLDTPIGRYRLVASARGLTGVAPEATLPSPTDEAPEPVARRHLLRARRALERYFAGDDPRFDALRLDAGGTPFQAEVWRGLRRIPSGETLPYAELARRIGRPRAARAVGAANARNPLAIVVPCHRVIGSDGGLGGYAGGVERKRWLLRHEAR